MSDEVKFDETCIDKNVQENPAEEDFQPEIIDIDDGRSTINNGRLSINDEGAGAVIKAPEVEAEEFKVVADEEAETVIRGDEAASGAPEDFADEPEAINDCRLPITDGIPDAAAAASGIIIGEPMAASGAPLLNDDERLQTNEEISDVAISEKEIVVDEPVVITEAREMITDNRLPITDEMPDIAIMESEPVVDKSEVDTEEPEAAASTESFEEMLEKSIKTLHTGQKVTGVITSITATEVSVDLGTKQSGYIPISEFTDDSSTRIEDVVKIGDTIESFVMRVNDVEGMVMLSKKRLDAIKNWDEIEASKDSKAIVTGIVTEENKGGIVVNVKGVRVFVPASQTGLPKSAPMTDIIRKTVKLRITEVNQSRRRVVGSIRAVQADERRERSDRLWEEIEKGKEYDGVVKSMTSYGVFVDIGGVDGMIHISELSWTRIKQPSEIMSIGDEVRVYVLSFDIENRKISLGYKKNEDNPWTKFTTRYSIGEVVNVRIVKMMPFGAFAEICPGVDGLIHISQISDHRIGVPSEVLSHGQLVDVKITEIDYERKKVSLSIRALIDPSSQPISDVEATKAINADKKQVVVYETETPPAISDGRHTIKGEGMATENEKKEAPEIAANDEKTTEIAKEAANSEEAKQAAEEPETKED